MEHYVGERVIVTGGRTQRGWLESLDDVRVVVRLPSVSDPESPGDTFDEFLCVHKRTVSVMTCSSWYDHHGVGIGYVDPTWSRDEESLLSFGKFLHRSSDVPEEWLKIERRVRELSLSVPLATATAYNDFGRAAMHERARADVGAN